MTMEVKIDLESPGILYGDEVPGSYNVEARAEGKAENQFSDSVGPGVGPVVGAEQGVGPDESVPPAMGLEQGGGPVVSAPPGMAVEQAVGVMAGANAAGPGTELKKKRGRPRKYGPDGKPLALSPMPISASIPLAGDTWNPSKGVSADLFKKKKKQKLEFGSPGSQVPYSVGGNFTPHMITVNVGEGHFEILSLSGSFMPTDSGGTKSRAGGMSVSLAGPDGRVLGGGLAGMLIAAGPVQVVIGSFLSGHPQEHKPKKHKSEVAAAFSPFPANHNSGQGTEMIFNTQQSLTPLPYNGNNLSFGNNVQGSTASGFSNDISLSGGPTDLSQTKFMVSC